MIVCIRTVEIPAASRERYLAWIEENRQLRVEHGILMEVVAEPLGGDGETVVITAWPSHEAFDAWIKTPDRDRLTGSDVHRSVGYRPITRYDVVGGYVDMEGLEKEDWT